MKIDVVQLLHCYIALLFYCYIAFCNCHCSFKTAKTQRRKGRPFGTPAIAKDCVFIIVFWLFLRINFKPQTLNIKLLNLPLTFAFCLLPTVHFSSLSATILSAQFSLSHYSSLTSHHSFLIFTKYCLRQM